MSKLSKELQRFLIAGCSAVGTDLATYYILSPWTGHHLAKGLSFISGSIVAYLINKLWTFNASKHHTAHQVIRFVLLYTTTLFANIAVNYMGLLVSQEAVFFAFIAATGTSTVLNFLGMKFWVFTLPPPSQQKQAKEQERIHSS